MSQHSAVCMYRFWLDLTPDSVITTSDVHHKSLVIVLLQFVQLLALCLSGGMSLLQVCEAVHR